MKIINPLEKITTERGLTDEKFRDYLVQGVKKVTFVNVQGCVTITADILNKVAPTCFQSDNSELTYGELFIYFVTSEVDLFLILGEKKRDNGVVASWGALPSEKIFAVANDLNIDNCYAGDYLKQRLVEYKDFKAYLEANIDE